MLCIVPSTVYAVGLNADILAYKHNYVFTNGSKYECYATDYDQAPTYYNGYISLQGLYVRNYESLDGVTWTFRNGSASLSLSNTWTPVHSTQNIINTADGTIFFLAPPPPIKSMVEVAGEIQPQHLLSPILAGLTLLVGLLVLATCFKKAWGFLYNQLKT